MRYIKATVYGYVPNVVWIGLLGHRLLAKKPNFCRFLDFGI